MPCEVYPRGTQTVTEYRDNPDVPICIRQTAFFQMIVDLNQFAQRLGRKSPFMNMAARASLAMGYTHQNERRDQDETALTRELCDLVKTGWTLGPSFFKEEYMYKQARGPRNFANWWEEHEEWDRQREAKEMEEKAQEYAKRVAEEAHEEAYDEAYDRFMRNGGDV